VARSETVAKTKIADAPYKEAAYDPAAADAFFRKRPFELLSRFAQLTQLSGGFAFNLILDKLLKREEDVVEERSQQLLELVTKLGPTFIKVGQLLSIRTDLLPAPYVAGLAQLQDAVPPFSGEQGRAIWRLRGGFAMALRLDDRIQSLL
jgi:predicted unusual protein kinase regulating ubiquinone biosynthesis (AarF/ABC1/UbiB family)